MGNGAEDDGATVVEPALAPIVSPTPPAAAGVTSGGGSVSVASSTYALTTAADALRNEEVERTRLFIRFGWVISILALFVVPLFKASVAMSAIFVTGLLLGILISLYFHQAFRDPRRYTQNALVTLCFVCCVNGHFTVLYYGVFTACPALVVIGIHFLARTELGQLARKLMICALLCYVAISAPIVFGVIRDPGVFASSDPGTLATRAFGALYVLGVYTLAYVTARAVRAASLKSIEQLQRATRIASQRQALLDELRVDLERALRVGAPGRHTDEIVGELKLGVLLGRGAMGEVYEAVHRGTGEPAAVKVLRRELLTDTTHLARFLREVKTSGALASRHIVRVIDARGADGALPYLAMERLRGMTLADLLRKEPRMSARAVADLLRQVGAGIDVASQANIVHRDLKPQNLMLAAPSGPPLWKILDFGVAALADETGGTLTQGGIVGTPSFMAPEQAQGNRVDSRADLYALAVIAYRALTGRLPFTGGDTPALLYAVVHDMPPRPGSLVETTPDVDRWFALALAKLAEDRLATGAELADAFDAAQQGALHPALRRKADALLARFAWSAA